MRNPTKLSYSRHPTACPFHPRLLFVPHPLLFPPDSIICGYACTMPKPLARTLPGPRDPVKISRMSPSCLILCPFSGKIYP
jgi:hypothetical protein